MSRPKVGARFGELLPSHGFSRLHTNIVTDGSAWRTHDGLTVISTLVVSELPGTHPPILGPQWHISVSRTPSRSTTADVQRVVDSFGMPAFDEDNHHPGIARHLWCPVDTEHRSACDCKITEVIVSDGDYQWTNPTDAPCRGCDYERLSGQPCPIHSKADVTT